MAFHRRILDTSVNVLCVVLCVVLDVRPGHGPVETCNASPERECQFRSENFHTLIVHYMMKETRESGVTEFPGKVLICSPCALS
jgi:hypothetical protein